ncbi:nucleoside recognition domain protein [Methanocaldococcus vulcanius M7]|uniref:Nucleoside recognition domain protein n=1 Tax=Methanocaldococcus vulcanius (strain ATCC 700851 / DSM 12094 / M7) TaxID=579137 RepID=C9RGB1_METVM|nr:nucleoside recognition domain-containing protein [Methanocaldococcus vulcanius]ACX72613.1 nucleoside recognition domain protein [Methanocaldococcus vulcanius M7]
MDYITPFIKSIETSAYYTIKISIIVLITMFLVSYFMNTGVMAKISYHLSPIMKKLKINPISASSILACFFSPTVGYSILAEGLREKKITEKELIGTSLANSFPSVLSHIFTFFIPVVIPILGLTGVIFVLIRLGVAFTKTIIGLVYLSLHSTRDYFETPHIENMNRKENIKKSFKRTLKFAKRLIPTMFFMMALVIYLSKIGTFDYIGKFVKPITDLLHLNPNVGILALTEIVNVQAAIVMAGGLLKENILTSKEVIIGLIIGNVLTFSTRYVKHSLPLHISLFGSRLGTKIVMINAIFTLILDIFVIIGLLLV